MYKTIKKKILTLTLLSFLFLSAVEAQKLYSASNASDNSSVITHNIPAYLRTGEVYSVSITMRNTGTNMWNARDYHLALYTGDNSYPSDVWGINTVDLPYSVSPSEKVIFNFNIKAPYTNGTFNCRWSMAKGNEYFGEIIPALVNVSGSESNISSNSSVYSSSSYIDQSVPEQMNSGQRYLVSITMRNTGNGSWLPYPVNKGDEYRLVSVNDLSNSSLNTDWGVSPVSVTKEVEPGQSYTFEFDVIAPSGGIYNFQWMMMHGGVYFGEKSKSVRVNVVGNINSGVNDASFINQAVPLEMNRLQDYYVTIMMKNTGKTTWTKDRYRLVLVDPKMLPLSYNPWHVGYIELSDNIVEPGAAATFTFKLTAPVELDTYYFQWSMMEEGTLFGEPTKPLQIFVGK